MFGILNIDTANDNDGSNGIVIAQFAASVSINSARVIAVSDSLSLRRLSSTNLAQRWEIKAQIYDPNFFIDYFVHNVINDVNTSIFIRPPLPVKKFELTENDPRGYSNIATETDKYNFSRGIAEIVSTETAGSDHVALRLNQGDAKVFKGDFVRFQNHSKLYMVTSVSIINASRDDIQIGLFPRLTKDLVFLGNANLGLNATMTCFYDNTQLSGLTYQDGILVESPKITFVEAL